MIWLPKPFVASGVRDPELSSAILSIRYFKKKCRYFFENILHSPQLQDEKLHNFMTLLCLSELGSLSSVFNIAVIEVK